MLDFYENYVGFIIFDTAQINWVGCHANIQHKKAHDFEKLYFACVNFCPEQPTDLIWNFVWTNIFSVNLGAYTYFTECVVLAQPGVC